MSRNLPASGAIQFDDPRLRRLMEMVSGIEREVRAFQQMLGSGSAGQVLTKSSHQDYDATWGSASAGAGEANEGANVGTGTGVFKDKSGVTLRFRTLAPGSGITLTLSADGNEITIAADTSDVGMDPLLIAGAF